MLNNKNNKQNKINAKEFFIALIKNGDRSLLTDLKITTAILHRKAAISAAIYPKYGIDITIKLC